MVKWAIAAELKHTGNMFEAFGPKLLFKSAARKAWCWLY